MTTLIRLAADSDDELGAIARLVNAVTPEDPTSVVNIRWAAATYPGAARWVAERAGRIVGAATVGRIYMYAPDFDAYWATVVVAPDARGQGIGSALLERDCGHARRAGKTSLHVPVSEARPEGIDFLTRRGFIEYERSKSIRLDLAGLAPPEVRIPDTIAITTLAQRPDLVVGVHAVAVEVFADVPGGDRPMDVGDLAEFRARDVDRHGMPADAFAIALDAASGMVVGYAALLMVPGSTTVASHDMTGVRRAYRGRGIARALKLTTIAWAIRNGLEALESGNDEDNAAMRTLNGRLGYQPLPDALTMRGPASGGIIAP